MKHAVGFQAVSGCVSMGCESVKPIVLYTEIILVYRVCHTKHVNILCRHNAEFLVLNLSVNTQDYWFIW